jgi:hypothetical protein
MHVTYSNILCGSVGANPPVDAPPGLDVNVNVAPPGKPDELEKPEPPAKPGKPAPGAGPPPLSPSSPTWS